MGGSYSGTYFVPPLFQKVNYTGNGSAASRVIATSFTPKRVVIVALGGTEQSALVEGDTTASAEFLQNGGALSAGNYPAANFHQKITASGFDVGMLQNDYGFMNTNAIKYVAFVYG